MKYFLCWLSGVFTIWLVQLWLLSSFSPNSWYYQWDLISVSIVTYIDIMLGHLS
jgi:hypothetical protein